MGVKRRGVNTYLVTEQKEKDSSKKLEKVTKEDNELKTKNEGKDKIASKTEADRKAKFEDTEKVGEVPVSSRRELSTSEK